MNRDNLTDRLDELENRIGSDDPAETLDDETRKQIEAAADPAEARRRLDREARRRFDRLEEEIAENGATDKSGDLTATGRWYLDFLLRGYPQT